MGAILSRSFTSACRMVGCPLTASNVLLSLLFDFFARLCSIWPDFALFGPYGQLFGPPVARRNPVSIALQSSSLSHRNLPVTSQIETLSDCTPASCDNNAAKCFRRAVRIGPDLMPRVFRLYWLRESGCDAGTPLTAAELEPTIAERVMKLTREGDGEIALHLPFLDKREWKRRSEVLASLDWVREGGTIRCVLDPSEATRDHAARLALTDEIWEDVPSERDPLYFKTWQTVSLRLQKALRGWIPEMYFRDVERYQDPDAAYPLVVYAAAKPCYGRPRTEFTFDVADPATLASACRTMGRAMQTVLAPIERRLQEAGKPQLSRR